VGFSEPDSAKRPKDQPLIQAVGRLGYQDIGPSSSMGAGVRLSVQVQQ